MKNNKGITLIALIITIIIMLILVAVTVSIIINTGILGKAKKAKDDTQSAYAEESRLGDSVNIGGTVYNSIDDVVNSSNQDVICLSVDTSLSEDNHLFNVITNSSVTIDYGDGTVEVLNADGTRTLASNNESIKVASLDNNESYRLIIAPAQDLPPLSNESMYNVDENFWAARHVYQTNFTGTVRISGDIQVIGSQCKRILEVTEWKPVNLKDCYFTWCSNLSSVKYKNNTYTTKQSIYDALIADGISVSLDAFDDTSLLGENLGENL